MHKDRCFRLLTYHLPQSVCLPKVPSYTCMVHLRTPLLSLDIRTQLFSIAHTIPGHHILVVTVLPEASHSTHY